ncbi:MAG TPA: hypothetical protein VLX92_13525 [Kofleriaceae bacterium]|nr:hypothetical protein [Kofleriaceae bacterium]
MIRIALVLSCLATTAARADVGDQLALYTWNAEGRAAARRCGDVAIIAERVRVLDAGYYATTFSTSPRIAACLKAPPLPSALRKSPFLAFALSFGTTAAGAGLLALAAYERPSWVGFVPGFAAIALGPTTGHIYAGKAWSWWLAARLAALGGAIAIVAVPEKQELGALFPLVGLGVVYAVGALGEIATAPRVAIDHNNALDEHQAVIVPMVTRGGGGLALAGSF